MTEVVAAVAVVPPATGKAAARTASALQNTGGKSARNSSMLRASVRNTQEQALIDQALEETNPEPEGRFVAAAASFLGFVAVQGLKLAIAILSIIATILFVAFIVIAGYTRKISTWAFTT